MLTAPSNPSGAWIDTVSGHFAWLNLNARWVDLASAAVALSLPLEAVQALGMVPWDLTANPHPEALAAAQSLGAFRFMTELDPRTYCRFTGTGPGQFKEFRLDTALKPLSQGDVSFLTPHWMRQPTRPSVPAPWLLQNLGEGDQGLGVCPLDGSLSLPALLDHIRPHVGRSGAWLALPDGRRWKLLPDTPPLVRFVAGGLLHGFEVCPDCGWPRQGELAPCKCWVRSMCKVCSMPSHWPIPMHETITLDGKMLYVPHMAGFAHRCIDWPRVTVMPFLQP